jgi:hypothetical protein
VRFARGKEEAFAPELSERVYKIKFLAVIGVQTFSTAHSIARAAESGFGPQ